jgi:hypothetical protein
MAVKRSSTLPESVRELGNRIEQWRKTRTHLCAMPANLWAEAAALARTHGIHPIAQALHVSYDSLKAHSGGRAMVRRRRDNNGAKHFVELLPGNQIFGAAHSDTVVEITNRAGDRFSIRFPAHAQLDLGGLTSALIARRP